MRSPIRAAALALGLLLAAASPASALKPRAEAPVSGRLSTAPLKIRDTIVHSRAHAARAISAAYGGQFTTADGAHVTVLESDAYQRDPQLLQHWADFFGSLVHGGELSRVTVYLAPYAEMQAMCGSAEVDSCYDTSRGLIVLLGGPTPDGVPIEDVAAHEYGHHIAENRLNDLGDAGRWGPEYWATAEHICQRALAGTAFPGDEGSHYDLNPGEGWAESYRVMNGYDASRWDIVSPSFYPDATALARARRDVTKPYRGGRHIDRTARFGARGRWREYVVPVQNDGRVSVKLRSTGSLDADLYVFASRSSKRWLARAVHSGRRESLTGISCGRRRLDIAVHRHRGAGRFRLRITLPYFS